MGVKSRVHGLRQLLDQDRIGVYNGVAVRSVAWYNYRDHYPNHKRLLAATVREYVEPGDSVVTVGGGKGVVETHAARAGGRVTTFEAGRQQVKVIYETAELNGVDIEPVWGIVGDLKDAYGETWGAVDVDPDSLEGDVLVLDCEGAETSILPQPDFDTVIVETHPRFDATTDEVRNRMYGPTEIAGDDPQDGKVVVRK